MTRDDIMIEFALRHVVYGGGYSADAVDWQINAMADEIIRLRAILAALREPSEAIVRAAQQTWNGDYCHMGVAIRAAVAAAEQEATDA